MMEHERKYITVMIEKALLVGLLTIAAIVSLAKYPCQVQKLMGKVQNVLVIAGSRGHDSGPDVTTERIRSCR